jgi:hypothetical protein
MIFKNILGVHNKASNLTIYTELGSYPVCFMSLLLMFRYYHRLFKIESEKKEVNSLLRSAFIEDKSLQKSWNKTMLNIKQKMNISSLDISNTEFSIQVRHFFENKLINQIENIKKTNTGKLCFHSNIFIKFQLQNYLHFPIAREKRSLLTKIRISAHSLTIETGRYNGMSCEDRFCQFCPSLVEDETYFLLRCAKYQNIRTSYNSLFQKEEGTNDADLLRIILNPESLSATKQICNSIKDASTCRNDET